MHPLQAVREQGLSILSHRFEHASSGGALGSGAVCMCMCNFAILQFRTFGVEVKVGKVQSERESEKEREKESRIICSR